MPPTADSSGPPKALLVVTVDRLPAWMLSAWGATWVATPALDDMAARGLVFDRLLIPALDPRTTVDDLLREPGGTSILSWAAAQGRRVAVVTDQPAMVAAAGVGTMADLTVVEAQARGDIAIDESATNLGQLFAAAGRLLAEHRHDVVWIHAGGLGIAWDAPDELRQTYLDPDDPPPPPGAAIPDHAVDDTTDPDVLVGVRHVFAAQLTMLDRCIGRLVTELGEGWLVLVAGLRGMPLGLHGWMGGMGTAVDERLPFSELIHVPAILVDAAGRMAGQRYGGLVLPADLGATLRELMGWETHPGIEPWRGRSLVPLLQAWIAEPRDRVVVRAAAGDAIVTPAWHLIDSGNDADPHRRMLFAKPDDFFERNDVADRCPAVAEDLAGVLGRGRGGDPGTAWRAPLSEAVRTGV